MASKDSSFDPYDDISFYRWATPILISILSLGKALPPPHNPTHREVFRLTLERMTTMSYHTLIANLDEKSYATISNLAMKPANCLRIGKIKDAWPKVVTEALVRDEWKISEVEKVGDAINGRHYVDGQVWDRMDGDGDEDVEM